MDGQRDSIIYDNCPSCQGPLVLKNSAKGNSYQSCPKSQGGCGWWTGQKEGEIAPKQSFPQKRNFSVNQGGQGSFRGGAKYSKPNPQPYSVTSPPSQSQGAQLPHKPTVVVEAKPDNDVSVLLLELFRQQLQQTEVNEELLKELCERVQTLQATVEELKEEIKAKK
jgi:hypothetical protein